MVVGRRFAPHCPACEDGHGVWRLLAIRGATRTTTYACTMCTHEWTIVDSRESSSPDTGHWFGDCPSCERGRGAVCGVRIDRENRTRTYRCDTCSHAWTVTDSPVH